MIGALGCTVRLCWARDNLGNNLGITCANEINFVLNHAPSARSIVQPVDHQSSALPLCYGCPIPLHHFTDLIYDDCNTIAFPTYWFFPWIFNKKFLFLWYCWDIRAKYQYNQSNFMIVAEYESLNSNIQISIACIESLGILTTYSLLYFPVYLLLPWKPI